jgi:hypothetical protein
MVLRIFLEAILSFILKAPLSCYASFWKPFSTSFEGPYMVLRIFLEAILSFF